MWWNMHIFFFFCHNDSLKFWWCSIKCNERARARIVGERFIIIITEFHTISNCICYGKNIKCLFSIIWKCIANCESRERKDGKKDENDTLSNDTHSINWSRIFLALVQIFVGLECIVNDVITHTRFIFVFFHIYFAFLFIANLISWLNIRTWII